MDYNTRLNHAQKVATKAQWNKLIKNGQNPDQDYAPVVKYFYRACTWLISEICPDGRAFGLCDLGQGSPELGYVDLKELANIGWVERDLHFKGNEPMSKYADRARTNGGIRE